MYTLSVSLKKGIILSIFAIFLFIYLYNSYKTANGVLVSKKYETLKKKATYQSFHRVAWNLHVFNTKYLF